MANGDDLPSDDYLQALDGPVGEVRYKRWAEHHNPLLSLHPSNTQKARAVALAEGLQTRVDAAPRRVTIHEVESILNAATHAPVMKQG